MRREDPGEGTARWPRAVWRREDPRAPVVAVLGSRGRHLVGEPLLRRGAAVVVERPASAGEGDLVLLRVPKRGGRHQVARRLGRPEVARDAIEGLLLHRGLRRAFPRKVTDEADAAAAVDRRADRGRRDLRDLPTLTIDPPDARDFDDAISAVETDGRVDVWVHIADVAAHVRPGGTVDGQARWRGTSVYVPGTVEPMLPDVLSGDACSLRPHVDRRAVSVRLEVDLDGGGVRPLEVVRSLIRSDARLDYDHVDRVLAGDEPAQDPWAAPLAAARRAAAALRDRRARGAEALTIESGEARFRLAADGHVAGVTVERPTESHGLIEQLMIAANAVVAERLSAARAPALHRVHDRPDPASVRRLADQLESLGVPVPPLPERPTPEEAAAAVGAFSGVVAEERRHRAAAGRPDGEGLVALVLRALQQARYATDGTGHAGLGLDHYCHFTSPIRRYPDLVVHRALLHLLDLGEDAPDAEDLADLATWCSATEREAMSIERTAAAMARAFLLERHFSGAARAGREETFAGEVVGLAPRGAFVRFGAGDLGGAFEGLLPVRLIHGDWWDLDELGTVLHGSRSGARIAIGDPLDVRVARIDPARGHVDLELA